MINQHRDVPPPQVPHRALETGGITLAPSAPDLFVTAVLAGGGRIVELGPETRGLVWLSEKNADELLEILSTHPGIGWVQLPWAGVDAFATVLATLAQQPADTRPVVTSAKGAYSEPVAEHALALLLGCMRELPRKAREAIWQPVRTGLSLYERHIVLVGAGGVGQAFIDVVAPLRPRITVVRRQAIDVPGAHRTITPDQLMEVLPTADAVVIAAAATTQTKHFLGQRELAALPAHAVVVNVARGSLVDADALVAALRAGKLFGAGLDVMDPEPFPHDDPIWQEHSVVITSHSADTPPMTEPLLAGRVEANVRAFSAGATLFGVVDVEAGY